MNNVPARGSCSPQYLEFLLLQYSELLLISYVKLIEKDLAFVPGLGLNASSTHRLSSLRRDGKIENFDTKTKFKKQKNMLPESRNLRSID
jgi:hypothetical protein